ncbi:MAG: diphthamide synthesis protein, partial [Candidatus Paceibacterota bacterium]
GILVSTKPGQNKTKQALALKKKLEHEGKKAYIFSFDNFDINQLENFPEIKCWINTMCPGLSREQPFVWIGDIKA